MTQRASGWYDDPDDPTHLRYWDGILWSDRRTPKIKPGLEGSQIGSPSLQAQSAQIASADARAKAAHDAAHQHQHGQTPPADPYAPVEPHQRRSETNPNPWAAPQAGSQPPAEPGGSHPVSTPPGQQPYGTQYPQGQQPQYPQGQQPQYPQYPQGQQPPYDPRFGGWPVVPPQPQTPDGQRLSGWWRRLAAYLIDSLLVSAVTIVLAWNWSGPWFELFGQSMDDAMTAAEAGNDPPPMPDELGQIAWQWGLIGLAVFAIYEIGMTVWRGRTVGKMVSGISVRMWDEARTPKLPEAAARFGIKGIASILFMVPLLGLLAALFTLVDGMWPLGDQKKQALHDRLPNTAVVIGPPTGPSTPAAPSDYPQR